MMEKWKDEYNSLSTHAIQPGVYYFKIIGGNIQSIQKVVNEK